MNRFGGFLRVAAVVALNFLIWTAICQMPEAGAVAALLTALYAWLGGYLSLLAAGAVSQKKLPRAQAALLEAAGAQLAEDIRETYGMELFGLKLYVVNSDELNASAYGAGCVSVTSALLRTQDPMTLGAVLGHEAGHLLHLDAEFNRSVFLSMLFLLLVGMASVTGAVVLFLVFLVIGCLRSLPGMIIYQKSAKLTRGFFRGVQLALVAACRGVIGLVSRRAEYRADQFSCSLGYGIQLIRFLELADRMQEDRISLAQILYRSHPPAQQRIARLEQQIEDRMAMVPREENRQSDTDSVEFGK